MDRSLPILLIVLLCACSEGAADSVSLSDEEASQVILGEPAEAARPTPDRPAASTIEGAPPLEDGQEERPAPQAPPAVADRANAHGPDESPSAVDVTEQPAPPGNETAGREAQGTSTLGVVLTEGTADMKLLSLAVGTAVEERTPVGVSDRFTTLPPKFHCHSVVDSRVPESTIIHTWRRGVRVVSRVELQVGKSPSWRTWSRQRIRPEWADGWSCAVTTLGGDLLGTANFEVVGGPEAP